MKLRKYSFYSMIIFYIASVVFILSAMYISSERAFYSFLGIGIILLHHGMESMKDLDVLSSDLEEN